MPKTKTSFTAGNKKPPGSGWQTGKPTVGDMLRRLMLYRERREGMSPVEAGFALIIDNVSDHPKEFLTLAKMAFKELREDFKLNVDFNNTFQRLQTDKEGLELAKQLSRRVQSGMGQPGLDGDAPGS